MRIEIKNNECSIDFENSTIIYGETYPVISIILNGKDIPITHAYNGTFISGLEDNFPIKLPNTYKD